MCVLCVGYVCVMCVLCVPYFYHYSIMNLESDNKMYYCVSPAYKHEYK